MGLDEEDFWLASGNLLGGGALKGGALAMPEPMMNVQIWNRPMRSVTPLPLESVRRSPSYQARPKGEVSC